MKFKRKGRLQKELSSVRNGGDFQVEEVNAKDMYTSKGTSRYSPSRKER